MALTKKLTIADLLHRKQAGQKFAMLTCYDATMAAWAQDAGVETLLVGDSLGGTVLGEPDTLGVGMDISVELTSAVRRGSPLCYLVADMPFLSYATYELALANAGRYLRQARADVVKMEVDRRHVDLVAALSRASIPVMAHLGLLPQQVAQVGGHKLRGKTAAAAIELIETAQRMEEAGAVALLLEGVPPEPARIVARRVGVPVVGCGAGDGCDGFVMVVHDMLGLTRGRAPKFVKKYADLGPAMQQAFEAYVQDVQAGRYPAAEHAYAMDEQELQRLREWAGNS